MRSLSKWTTRSGRYVGTSAHSVLSSHAQRLPQYLVGEVERLVRERDAEKEAAQTPAT